MQMPPAIADSAIAGTDLAYQWDTDVSSAIMYPEDRFPRLANAYGQCDHRTAFGMAMATAEWSVWRFSGIVDIQDGINRVEAGYAAVIDARYAEIARPSEPFPTELQDAHGPLKLARKLVSMAWEYHAVSDDSVHDVGFSLALLALHLYAESPALEAWLERTLRRCHALHPPSDAPLAAQRPVARSFFFAAEDAPDTDPAELRAFLAGLDDARNPYLRAAWT